MSGPDFQKEMKRLIDRWKKTHPNAYPKSVQKIFWDRVQTLSHLQWNITIDHVIADNSFPAMFDKIKPVIQPMLDKNYKELKERRKRDAERAIRSMITKEQRQAERANVGNKISKFVRQIEKGNFDID